MLKQVNLANLACFFHFLLKKTKNRFFTKKSDFRFCPNRIFPFQTEKKGVIIGLENFFCGILGRVSIYTICHTRRINSFLFKQNFLNEFEKNPIKTSLPYLFFSNTYYFSLFVSVASLCSTFDNIFLQFF